MQNWTSNILLTYFTLTGTKRNASVYTEIEFTLILTVLWIQALPLQSSENELTRHASKHKSRFMQASLIKSQLWNRQHSSISQKSEMTSLLRTAPCHTMYHQDTHKDLGSLPGWASLSSFQLPSGCHFPWESSPLLFPLSSLSSELLLLQRSEHELAAGYQSVQSTQSAVTDHRSQLGTRISQKTMRESPPVTRYLPASLSFLKANKELETDNFWKSQLKASQIILNP